MMEPRPEPMLPTTGPRCRTCGKAIASDFPTAPFCSQRCRMADLGRWFAGEYRISREIQDSDLEAGD